MPSQQESSRTVQTKTSQTSQHQQQRISGNFLPTSATIETTMRSFYPTPRPSPKSPQSLQSVTHQVTQHIHVPQLKPHQITINLPPPDIQRIVQNPSPLLPSQSRVIVTAKASVSDESGRPLNTTQLVTLPLPTIPASYDDYKEGDESFDPFYRDVPKIRNNRQNAMEKIRFSRAKRSLEQPHHFVYGVDSRQDFKVVRKSEPRKNEDNAINKESTHVQINLEDFRALKESLIKFKDILFSDNVNEDSSHNDAKENKNNTERVGIDSKTFDTISVKQVKDNAIKKVDDLEDLKTEASKHFNVNKNTDEEEEDEETSHENSSTNIKVKAEKSLDEKKHIKDTSELEIYIESTTTHPQKNESQGDVIDLIILDSDNNSKVKDTSVKTDAPIEIIIKEETKSNTHDASKTNGKVAHRGQIAGSLTKDDPEKRSNSVAGERRQLAVPHETIKRNGVKDDGERNSGPRRKSSRPRSSKRRISSRIRQQRVENIEPTETIQQKERTTTATTVIDTTTVTSTSTTTTTSTTTVTPSITAFEKKVAEQIDSNIFGDSESQTFKELDTRAIGHRDAIYSKSLQDGKNYDASRSKDIERSFGRQIMEEHTRSSELHADKIEEEKQETELPDYTQTTEEKDTTENPSSAKEARSTEVTHVSEEKSSTEEEDLYKEYEFPGDDETDTNERGLEESSQDRSSKISSDEVATSREGNLEEESTYREDASEKSSTDISDEEQNSTANYSEEVNSEELNEYQDITESSAESTRSIQEDYKEYSESTESSMMDYTNSEDYTDSQEDIAGSIEDGESSTEGVLKFTDELPLSDDNEDEETTEESSTSNESDVHDYIDDNYEPENYKTEIATESNEFEEDKSEEKNDEEKKDMSVKDPDRTKNIEKSDDSIEMETQTDNMADVTKIKDFQEIASLTTTSSTTTPALTTTTSSTTTSTTMASSTTASSTTASTTTTSITTESITTASSSTPITTTITTPRSTITTRRPKTTTLHATPPKILKPTGNKRIYAYIPPTTTPNPVVIKPRLGLFNPKPAKPIKSYNELVPKPTIRKLILPTRKSTTTTTEAITTTTEMLNTENPEMTTEPVTVTTAASTTAATMATAMTTAATTTTMATTTVEATTTAATITTVAATTTTESSRSEENGLESKLEVNEHISLDSPVNNDQTNKEDQFPNPSEQNTSANSSKTTDPGTTTTKIETFTPYPLSKISTLAPSIEWTTKEIDIKPQETTEDIDTLVSTTIPPTTLLSEKSEYAEITSSTEKYFEITETTIASTSKVYQQETTLVTSVPSVPERATSVSVLTTVLPKAEDSDPGASMEAAILRSSNRKLVKPRKHASFNCLEKEMYRFYGDFRDCRLFHYCSPGFTSRQVLDFRFVCEEGTAFDEVTQSCRHEMRNRMCRNRSW